jgi:gallate dioxygenase
MANLIGGIGRFHVPTIGLACDKKRQNDPAWAPLFEGYKPVAKWLEEKKPVVLVFFYNDHANSCFFDCYPTFSIGCRQSSTWPTRARAATQHQRAREAGRTRRQPPGQRRIRHVRVPGPAARSWLQFALALMWPHEPAWPGAILPIAINVLQHH